MVRYSFMFFILFILGVCYHILSPRIATSVIPGWHLRIFPSWFFVTIIQVVWLGFCAVIYFLIERKEKTFNHNIFLIHVFLPLSLFLQKVYLYFDNHSLVNIVAATPYALYFIGQCFFIYGILSTKVDMHDNSFKIS